MINDFETNMSFLDNISEYSSLEELNTLAFLLDKKVENIEAVEAYMQSYELTDLTEIMNVIMQEEKIEYYTYEFEGMEMASNMSPEEKYGYTMLTLNGYLDKLEEMGLDWCIDVEKYGSADEQSGYVDLYENGYLNTTSNSIVFNLYSYNEIKEMIDGELNHKNICNIKDIDNILKLEVSKGVIIENFIKTTDEGRKLIPENGNIGTISIEKLNEALEKEEYNKIEFKNAKGKLLDNSITLVGIQNLVDKEKQNQKKKSNEEEM